MAGDVGQISYGAAIVEDDHIHQIAADLIAGVGTAVDLELGRPLMDWRDERLLNAMCQFEFVANAIGFLAFVPDEIDEEAVGHHDDGYAANRRKGDAGAWGYGLEVEMILYEIRKMRAKPDQRTLGEDQQEEAITRQPGDDNDPDRGSDAAVESAGQDCWVCRASASHQVAEKTEDAKQ